MIEFIVLLISFLSTLVLTKLLIPKLKAANIIGIDENKENNPKIPEMGGLAIIGGLVFGILVFIFYNTFIENLEINLIYVLAALASILSIAMIGVVDDLISLPQWFKAFTPLAAAIPLIAVKAATSTVISIPFLGSIDFGIYYVFILVPIGVAVASNLTNMLAGLNGLDIGLGAIMFFALALLSTLLSNPDIAAISFPMLGALLAFLLFNFYPSKIFPGDVGSLTIGATLANAVIIGNFETAGAILLLPHAIDFLIKIYNRFPHTYQEIKEGKLYPKEGKIKGLIHVIIRNGLKERNAVFVFYLIEVLLVFVIFALYIF